MSHPDADLVATPPGAVAVGAGAAGPADAAALADALLAASGRLAWLEAMREASRSVRHDLANALTGISFYSSELVADLPEGTPGARDAAAIGEEVARGMRLLDRLLELGREPSETEVLPLDAAAVVDRIAALLGLLASPSDLVVGPLDSIVVRASRRALEEALLVLVLDARTVGGQIRISVEAVAAGEVDGLPTGRSAAIRVTEEVGAWVPGAGREPAPTISPVPVPEAALGVALASAAARGGGGRFEGERRADGARAWTLLLPEAASRRRRAADEEDSRG